MRYTVRCFVTPLYTTAEICRQLHNNTAQKLGKYQHV